MAVGAGFEPAEGVNPQSLSRRSRYGRFGTPPATEYTRAPPDQRLHTPGLSPPHPAFLASLRKPNVLTAAHSICAFGVVGARSSRRTTPPHPPAIFAGGDVRERPNRRAWRARGPSGSKSSNLFVSASVLGLARKAKVSPGMQRIPGLDSVGHVRPDELHPHTPNLSMASILDSGRARWGARGPLYRKPSIAGPNARLRLADERRSPVSSVDGRVLRDSEP